MKSALGQMITFATEVDDDRRFAEWHRIHVRNGDTIRRIAARLGHPDDARRIGDKNKVRSLTRKLRGPGVPKKKVVRKLMVPGNVRPSTSFDVLAGDEPPTITDGYAKLSTVDRPERVGLTAFDGYNPITMTVPIRFEAYASGSGVTAQQIENRIAQLEEMAGRGNFSGAAVGPPQVVRVSTYDKGNMVPLIPVNYQWSEENKTAPVWRVAGIEWDSGALRDGEGNRIRQLATVTLQQHTRISLLNRGVTARSKSKKKKGRDVAVKGRGFGNVPL